MKKIFLVLGLIAYSYISFAQQWVPVQGKIMTPWAEKMNTSKVLPEYPRPQMVREDNWENLNGLWDYAIKKNNDQQPSSYDGKILVPYAVESALSGVGKTVGKDSILWYKTTFNTPKNLKGKKTMLNFGGVDWRAEIFLNGKKIGMHEGCYDPFSFDITSYLTGSTTQELIVKVWDPTSDGPQPRGKQVNNPRTIWYTPVTGIWQTVWLEYVPETYIVNTKHTPDIDNKTITVTPNIENLQTGDVIKITAWDGAAQIAEQTLNENKAALLNINSPKLWSPENPFLYDLKVSVLRKGKVVDEIKSYFAMRKISMAKDKAGIQRMLLNNQFVFQYGPLDQGWWPDGLYTAPCDEALKFDIVKTKEMGFNMIRKHIKVEPARWYYYCDQLGMLVWQDMPSGDNGGNEWLNKPGIVSITKGHDKIRASESESYYRKEWDNIINTLYNFPSIVVWVPFNEAWGQFKTVEITNWTMQKDPSRIINSASGGNFTSAGHIIDVHNYPEPAMPRPDLFGKNRALVLGEFGGLGLPVEKHTWQDKNNWGYQSFQNADTLFTKYASFMSDLEKLITQGLSAAVYTQTTDVEIETNGLMSYDRKVIKVPEQKLKEVHQKLYNSALVKMKE